MNHCLKVGGEFVCNFAPPNTAYMHIFADLKLALSVPLFCVTIMPTATPHECDFSYHWARGTLR